MEKIKKQGRLEVICGPMFSGTSEELIRRIRRAQIARQHVITCKHSLDDRTTLECVVSHDGNKIEAHAIESVESLYALGSKDNVDIVGIDEAQFFDNELVNVCNTLANRGVRVIVAGLDMDYLGNPFGPMPQLMAIAEHVTKLHAICISCGNLAQYSFRKSDENKKIVLGETDRYEALCRQCFVKKSSTEKKP